MMRKLLLATGAAIGTAIIAFPAVASAGEWEMDPAGWQFTIATVGNAVLKTNNNETITCTSENGSGQYNAGSKATGTIELALHGCKESIFGTSCSSAGQPAGTITTTSSLPFTNVYLDGTGVHKTPGLTIRGTETVKHFTTFICAGGSVKMKLTGSMLGNVESACGTLAEEHKIEFKDAGHGSQEFTRVTASLAEPIDDLVLETNIFGATNHRTTSIASTTILKSNIAGEKATVTCV
jgi:hypothetical protein